MTTKCRGRRGKGRNESKFPKVTVQYLLEAGTLNDIRLAKQVTDEHLKYQWNYYSELARQRSAIQDQTGSHSNKHFL
ncbi:MAG: hypothetical protein P4M12_11825 [Gammaproteobacteria bacterium]|nr:hypothetical protein [Gammaproteobacteria bacterium]